MFRSQIFKIPYLDNKVALAIRGDWINFKDSVVTDLLNKTVKLQRDFWKDHSQEYFTVILLPIENEVNSYSYSGTGLFNSFTTVFSNNGYEDVYDLTYLFNHELMHNWINVENITKNEEQQYWFSEGFTDYYTHKNIAKNKVLGLDEEYWLDKINKTIKDLYTSPVAESPNSEMNTENYWTNRDYEQLPYRRGGLLAFIIDHKIRKESNGNYSLDHVMREIFTRVKEDKSIINEEFFVEIANKYTKTSLASFIEKHVIQGKLPDLQEIFTTYDFKFNAISEVFDLGFQPNEEYNKIISIDTTSRAYKAGLRATDRLGRWGFSYGVMDKEIKMNVVRDEQKLVIKYFPVKEMGIPTLQNNEHNITILKSMN